MMVINNIKVFMLQECEYNIYLKLRELLKEVTVHRFGLKVIKKIGGPKKLLIMKI